MNTNCEQTTPILERPVNHAELSSPYLEFPPYRPPDTETVVVNSNWCHEASFKHFISTQNVNKRRNVQRGALNATEVDWRLEMVG